MSKLNDDLLHWQSEANARYAIIMAAWRKHHKDRTTFGWQADHERLKALKDAAEQEGDDLTILESLKEEE